MIKPAHQIATPSEHDVYKIMLAVVKTYNFTGHFGVVTIATQTSKLLDNLQVEHDQIFSHDLPVMATMKSIVDHYINNWRTMNYL